MFVVLAPLPLAATVAVFGIIVLQVFIAGTLANRLLPGLSGDFILELPRMRVPKIRHVLVSTVRQTLHFMKEAIPYFLLASLVLFAFDRVGGLDVVSRAAHPVVHGFLRLPDETVQVLMKTLIRRENGATELQRLSSHFSNLQLVVTMLVMTFLSPCVNATVVLFKERGWRMALTLLVAVSAYAVLAGGAVGYVCRLLGVTFA